MVADPAYNKYWHKKIEIELIAIIIKNMRKR